MDIAELALRLQASWSKARLFDIKFRGATFHYHLPDDFEIRNVAINVKTEADVRVDVDTWMLELFKRSLIGWEGLTESVLEGVDVQTIDVTTLPDENESATIQPVLTSPVVPYDRDLALGLVVAWVKEYRVAWDALVDILNDRVMSRRKAKEEGAKN